MRDLSRRIWDLGLRRVAEAPTLEGQDPRSRHALPVDEREGTRAQQLVEEIHIGRTLLMYAFVVLGVLSKQLLDQMAKGQVEFTWQLLMGSLILSAVVFRSVFGGKLQGVHHPVLQLFVAFENGFFVDAVMKSVVQLYK